MGTTLVYPFAVTIPAGTTKAVPSVALTQFEQNIVERVEWVFPPGCNGQVGIQLGARSVPVLPTSGGKWFTSSGDTHGLDLKDMHNTGDWSVIGYNLGAFAHTVQVTFVVHRIPTPAPDAETIGDLALSEGWPGMLGYYG